MFGRVEGLSQARRPCIDRKMPDAWLGRVCPQIRLSWGQTCLVGFRLALLVGLGLLRCPWLAYLVGLGLLV